ncbi:DUF2249 domain-containing protein [Gammaproteobacteria bacterium]
MDDFRPTERVLDVSRLDPPEPFELATAALYALQEGEFLRLLHRCETFPLYTFLDAAGFNHHAVPGNIPPFEVYIWHRQDTTAAAQVDARLSSHGLLSSSVSVPA